jgi:hypothetical protein
MRTRDDWRILNSVTPFRQPDDPHPTPAASPDERAREEILASARPLPDDWGFSDLTDDERDAFLAAVAEA